jgi:DNA mismatch endonuclease, patch repair protein
MRRSTPSFRGLSPASVMSSRIARAGSMKRDTAPELLLRRALWGTGLRYKIDAGSLPGRPDLAIPVARLAVFCDGDFWHGRSLRSRLNKLRRGHNASYWVSKIRANVQRDRRVDRLLRDAGWTCLRLWETDVRADPQRAAAVVLGAIARRSSRRGQSRAEKRRAATGS